MTDHWDGPAARNDPAADITDFFVFPVVESGQTRLVLVMNVHPNATPDTRFSDAVDYRLRVRRVTAVRGPGQQTGTQTGGDEFTIVCTATGGEDDAGAQAITFQAGNTWADGRAAPQICVRVAFGDVGGGDDPRLRAFAGVRADTSFTDLARVRLPVWRDIGFADKPGVNSIAGHNVLSLVASVDVQEVLGGTAPGSLFAACGETLRHGPGKGGSATVRIDRMGNIEVNVWIIQDDSLRDRWNAEDTFAVSPAHVAEYTSALQAGLHRLDDFEKSLTGENVIDWPDPHPMVPVLLNDYLVVDVSRPTRPSSTGRGYLEIIKAAYLGVPHQTCGGRVPNEDVIATALTWFINGPDRPQPDRGVGVTPDKPVTDEFPYLREPTVPPPTLRLAHGAA